MSEPAQPANDFHIVKGKRGKVYNINLDDKDRREVRFEDCVNCTITIGFQFKGLTLEEGYKAWKQRPRSERAKQLVVLKNCSKMTVKEDFSLETQFYLIDTKESTVNIVNSDGTVEVVNCEDVTLIGIMIKEMRAFLCKDIQVECNNHCLVVEHKNENLKVTRRWDLDKIMNSDQYAAAVEQLQQRVL